MNPVATRMNPTFDLLSYFLPFSIWDWSLFSKASCTQPSLSIEAGRPNLQISHVPKRLDIRPIRLHICDAVILLLSFVALSASQMSLTTVVTRRRRRAVWTRTVRLPWIP